MIANVFLGCIDGSWGVLIVDSVGGFVCGAEVHIPRVVVCLVSECVDSQLTQNTRCAMN